MKQNKSIQIFFFLVFLLPLKLFAQQDVDITGVWKGQLYDKVTAQMRLVLRHLKYGRKLIR
jgi:hypothetical protein